MQLQNILRQFDVRDLGKVESYRNLAFVRLLGEDRFTENILTLDEVIGREQF